MGSTSPERGSPHGRLRPARALVAPRRPGAYHRGVERIDVLVVGAGPAGSVTAIRLAHSGARVLLVDKARFPRDKPCGGGLTGRALKHLPCDVGPVVEHVVDRMVVRAGYGGKVARSSPDPLIVMTQRRRLDLHLAEHAAAAGADFRDGIHVGELEIEDERRHRAGRRVAGACCISRRGRRRERRRRAARGARRRDRARGRARGERALGDALARAV